jgi:hypothetical protein
MTALDERREHERGEQAPIKHDRQRMEIKIFDKDAGQTPKKCGGKNEPTPALNLALRWIHGFLTGHQRMASEPRLAIDPA